MRIKNKTFAVVWKLALILVATPVLLDSFGLLGSTYGVYFFNYFTNVSNLAAYLYFVFQLIHLARTRDDGDGVPPAPLVKQTVTMGLVVTFVVASTMLNGFRLTGDLVVNLDLLVLHFVVPGMTVADWLLFDRKGLVRPWAPLVWAAFPLAYLVFIEVGVNVLGVYMGGEAPVYGMYPYPFLQHEVMGVAGVAGTCALLLAAIVALGYVVYALDRALGRFAQTRASGSGRTVDEDPRP